MVHLIVAYNILEVSTVTGQDQINTARQQVAQTVNSTMVLTYWQIGRLTGHTQDLTITRCCRISTNIPQRGFNTRISPPGRPKDCAAYLAVGYR